MKLTEWIHELGVELADTPLLQWVGAGLGVVEVLLAKANNILLYPFGIGGILITLYVLFDAGLYAEIMLNLYYLAMSSYGWVYWVRRGNAEPVPVTYSSRGEWVIALLITGIGFPAIYYALANFTDSTVPVWDAWVSATAWAGMWLLAKRKIENWILLNISNAFAIPLLVHKNLYVFALLTLFLFVVAVFGYFDWRRIIGARRETAKIVSK